MGAHPSERAIWLAQYVLPSEPALRRWLTHYRVPGLDVDDVIQETYAILAGLKSVEDIRSPKKYAFQTAYSIILAHLRRARIVSITAVADMDFLGSAADEPSPECQACDRDELRNVTETMAALPQRVREVFVLRRIEGLSQRDVAERLGISENTVEKCVAKGVQTLTSAFKRGGKAPPNPPDRKQGSRRHDLLLRVRGKKSI